MPVDVVFVIIKHIYVSLGDLLVDISSFQIYNKIVMPFLQL